MAREKLTKGQKNVIKQLRKTESRYLRSFERSDGSGRQGLIWDKLFTKADNKRFEREGELPQIQLDLKLPVTVRKQTASGAIRFDKNRFLFLPDTIKGRRLVSKIQTKLKNVGIKSKRQISYDYMGSE